MLKINSFFYDPLEQFEVGFSLCKSEIVSILGLPSFSFIFGVAMLSLLSGILWYLAIAKIKLGRYVKLLWLQLIKFLATVGRQNLSPDQYGHFPIVFFIFLVIVLSNILGMVPYSITLTSQMLLTLIFSSIVFITISILGVIQQKTKIVNLFLPSGTPLAIAPFLTLIEIISYISRILSLAIRLFANMTAGHTLLKILCGFGYTLLCIGSVSLFLFIFPVLVVSAVTCL
jgi:F-type H+-transporting ATPase subunit a